MTPTSLLPLEMFFSAPTVSKAQISPDGTKVAYLMPWKNRLNIWVRPLSAEPNENLSKCLTDNETRNIEGFCWTLDSKAILFVQDSKGDENWHLHLVRVSDTEHSLNDLTPYPNVRVMSLELSVDKPDKAFVQMNYRHSELIDLYEIDLHSGALTLIAENPGRFVTWVIIPGNKLHAFVINEEGNHELTRYEEGNFISVAVFKGLDYPLRPMPIRATSDGKGVIVGANTGTDRRRLLCIDLETGL